jgi:hypothetical protein
VSLFRSKAAANGEIGHVDGFLMDDEAWLILLHRGGHAGLVAGWEGAGLTRVGHTREFGGFEGLGRPFPESHQERPRV